MKDDKACGKVYVKVFSLNHTNKEEFYRDGYTDIRGKFEYASTSGEKLKQVKKFSVLVQSERFGSQIKVVEPPKDETVQVQTAGAAGKDVSALFGGAPSSSLVQQKQERMVNRHNWAQSKRCNN